MRPLVYVLAGIGAATIVAHGYMRGWNRIVSDALRSTGRSKQVGLIQPKE